MTSNTYRATKVCVRIEL